MLSPELYEKLHRLKGLLAHAKPDASYAELIEYAADVALAKIEHKKGIRSASDAHPSPTAAAAVKVAPPGVRGHQPVTVTRPLWARSGGQCEIVRNGRRCTARHRLEIDHIVPLALGGSNEPSNLRLACWHHNQQLARKMLGS